MKKLTGISLFIFFCVITAILTAGLVFYEKKNNPSIGGLSNNNTNVKNLNSNNPNSLVGVKIFNINEVAKHNKNSDCWIIVNNKIYDISNYASSHPGGSRNITNYCGKESTQAFDTRGGEGASHSRQANKMLDQFYIGNLV